MAQNRADEPRKVGVYDGDETTAQPTAAAGGRTRWWVIGLVVLLVLLAILFLM